LTNHQKDESKNKRTSNEDLWKGKLGKIIISHGKKRVFYLFVLFHRLCFLAYVFCYFVVLHPVYDA
jgi:hypothetical protein